MTLLLARLFQILLSVVSIKLTTHFLAPEQMGRLALANSIIAFFSFMFMNPIGMFMNRRMHSWWHAGRWLGYQGWFALYVLVVAMLAGVSLLAGLPVYDGLRMSAGWMLVLIGGSILSTTGNQLLISSLNLLGFARPFAALTVLTPLLGLILSWWLCTRWGERTEYWLLGVLLGQVAMALVAVAVFCQRWTVRSGSPPQPTPLSEEGLRRLYSYAWPISIAVVLGWLQNQGYRLVMENLVGLGELGMFVAAYGIALGIMSAVESLLGSLLQPNFYRRLHEASTAESTAAWNEYAAIALPVLVLTATTLAAASTEAVHIFLAPSYWGTANYVCWAAAIELTRTAANIYSLCMHAEMNTRRLMGPSLLGAVLSIAFLSVAARYWGLDGVGPALAAAGLLYSVSWHRAARRLAPVALPVRQIMLALAGGGLGFAVVSAIHLLVVPMGVVARTVVGVLPSTLIYLLVATILLRPAIASRQVAS